MPFRSHWWIDLEDSFGNAFKQGVKADWIEYFNWLGQQHCNLMFSGNAPWMEDLVHQFCTDPQGKRGLLTVLAGAAECGNKCVIPQHILDAASALNDAAKRNAIILALANDGLKPQILHDLAKEVTSDVHGGWGFWHFTRAASIASPVQGALFSLAVRERLILESEEACSIDEGTRENLLDYLMKKSSALNVPKIWERLELPTRV
jgi:hypothetical protein